MEVESETGSSALVGRDAHILYLQGFLTSGFAALEKLAALQAKQQSIPEELDAPRLLGLGPEKSGKLLAASCAEPRLLSVLYWVSCGLTLLDSPIPSSLQDQVLQYLLTCKHSCGGFSPHPAQPADLLATLSAVQIILLLGREDLLAEDGAVPAELVAKYAVSLQLPDGGFVCRSGSSAEESDCRFVYSALNLLSLLQPCLDEAERDFPASLATSRSGDWLLRCQNSDGGFGCRPDGACESHAGHTFCCLAGLSLLDMLSSMGGLEKKRLCRWLALRQQVEGGLNGRPGKAPDVCYTWWVLSSTAMLGLAMHPQHPPSHFCHAEPLRAFVHSCMSADGGVAAHPGDDPDPFHTFFGLAGLALLDAADADVEAVRRRWGIEVPKISPVLAMPLRCIPPRLSTRVA